MTDAQSFFLLCRASGADLFESTPAPRITALNRRLLPMSWLMHCSCRRALPALALRLNRGTVGLMARPRPA